MPKFIPYTEVTSPRWADEARTAINVSVVFPQHGPEPLPFTAGPVDPECPHSEEIYQRAIALEFGPIGAYQPKGLAVPQAISDRQFFQALATPPFSIISQAEALAAVKTGELPAALQALVSLIEDDAERFEAEMLLSGAVEFLRAHPRVHSISSAYGWTELQTDDFFRFAATL